MFIIEIALLIYHASSNTRFDFFLYWKLIIMCGKCLGMKVDDGGERSKWSRYCFMWSRIVLSGSITLILGVFGVVYTIRQGHLARIHRQQDQYDNEQVRQQMIYDSYMDQVSKLFLSRANLTSVDMKLHLRIKTLNTLRYVSLDQKTKVFHFSTREKSSVQIEWIFCLT